MNNNYVYGIEIICGLLIQPYIEKFMISK